VISACQHFSFSAFAPGNFSISAFQRFSVCLVISAFALVISACQHFSISAFDL
jgi:hypothetical protein